MWAKAGFYRAGGATGFRDQLQDAMALAWPRPPRCASTSCNARRASTSRATCSTGTRPWAPACARISRTTCCGLAHACAHYLQATGDTTLLDVEVAFLEGPAIPTGAEDSYGIPAVSTQTGTVYEHAARAIDRSLAVAATVRR